LPEGVQKAVFCSHAIFEQLLHIKARGLMEICENSKAICEEENKTS
jgi:hypothetical protein